MLKIIWLSWVFFCAVSVSAADADSLFDKPLSETHISIAPDPANPQNPATLSCFYYPHLMVKQIDLGAEGADQLSMTFIPTGQKAPACQRKNGSDEQVIDPGLWSGYFKGVKGGYVFFDGVDGADGGEGFAVFSAANTDRIFDDNAGDIHSIELMTPRRDIDQRPWYENPIELRYQRVYLAPCSLHADAKGCWAIIRNATGLTESAPPDCSASYRALESDPASRSMADADPSVIRYEVELVLDDQAVIRVTPISPASDCGAAE